MHISYGLQKHFKKMNWTFNRSWAMNRRRFLTSGKLVGRFDSYLAHFTKVKLIMKGETIMENLTRETMEEVDRSQLQPFKWVMDLVASGRILIAGCSGSGKSVALKDIIYTLMACNPDTNQFVFIDLKRVELKVFKSAPHCVCYVTEPGEVLTALNTVLDIIDDRYKKMERKDELKSSEPNLWVVVDEYADLVTVGNKGIERAIQRIAQIGRASRVNLILCTQRPTKDILNGKISCNLDSRLALRTVNGQDSRNIIGVSGAEELPDYGKAIMQIRGRNKKIEIPFLEQEELSERVRAWHNTPRVYVPREPQKYTPRMKQDPNVHVYSVVNGKRKEITFNY